MKARDIMRPAPIVVDSVDSLGDAHELMRANTIRHLPVVHDGRLVGMLSERDLLDFRANLGPADDWREVAVSGVMTRAPRTAGPDDAVTEVAGRLAVARIGALPIVERGKVIGIVAVSDVLEAEVRRAMAPRRAATAATAADAMTPGPFCAHATESLLAAARRMSTHGVRHLPVVDDGEHVIGMLSERDLRTAVGDPARFAADADRSSLRVEHAMSRDPITVPEDRSILEVARLFEDKHIGAVPVVDRARRIVGILSYVDALHALAASGAVP